MKAPTKTLSSDVSIKSGFRRAVALALAALAAVVAVSCSPPSATEPTGASRPDLQATPDSSVAGVRAASAPPTVAPTAIPVAGPTVAPTAAPSIEYEKVKPNELGTIPILEYHIIADAEEDQWTLTPTHFRQGLRKLYEAGYRPISMAELLDNSFDLPAGISPALLTFDDSSPGQFRFIEKDGQLVVDPNSAVGILEEFHATNPDWPLKGVFYVLPEADQPHKLFGQPEYEEQKLRYLVDRGFEIGNHTWWHQRLDIVDDEEVQRQLASAVRSIQQAVPGYLVRTIALPQGMWPENRSLVIEGAFEGVSYRHEAILLVGSDPAPSPNSKDYDPHALPRVQVFGDSLDRWLDYLANNADERYVSDGDPSSISFPKRLESQLSPTSVDSRAVRSY